MFPHGHETKNEGHLAVGLGNLSEETVAVDLKMYIKYSSNEKKSLISEYKPLELTPEAATLL